MFAHQEGMMDEGTAGEIGEINNKGIIAMCLITSWGRTSLGQRVELAESFLELGSSQILCWWVLVDAPKRSQLWAGVLWVHCL